MNPQNGMEYLNKENRIYEYSDRESSRLETFGRGGV